MTNYTGMMRTNYFRVTDLDALVEALPEGLIEVVHGIGDEDGTVALIGADPDGINTLAPVVYDEVLDDDVVFDIPDIVSEYLVEGEVAVFQHTGGEGSRFVAGAAVAVIRGGDRVEITLDGIYALAAEKFKVPSDSISPAMY